MEVNAVYERHFMFPNVTIVNFEDKDRLSWMNLQPQEVNRDQVRWCLCYRDLIGSSNLAQAIACLTLLLVACITTVAMLVNRALRGKRRDSPASHLSISDAQSTAGL